MLFTGSNLKIVDNSGGKIAKCLKNFKRGSTQTASIGDLILVCLQKFRSRKKITKRVIYMGLVVGVKY
jgi:ribosomal protein L14